MNENPSSSSSTSAPHHGLTAEAISRRAYELWEKEGRPENRDLHHWLRAEHELLAEQGNASPSSSTSAQSQSTAQPQTAAQPQAAARAQNTDVPLQAPRSAPPAGGKSKRGSTPPFSGEKAPTGRSQPGTRSSGRS